MYHLRSRLEQRTMLSEDKGSGVVQPPSDPRAGSAVRLALPIMSQHHYITQSLVFTPLMPGGRQ